MSSPGAPTWLVAVLITFALAASVTFGLFLYNHARAASLAGQYAALTAIKPSLNDRQSKLRDLVPKLDEAIKSRRDTAAAVAELEKSWAGTLDRLVQENKGRLGAISDDMRKEVKTYNDLMKEAPDRRAEVGREEERAYAQDHDFDENRAKLRDEVEVAARTLETGKKKGRSELTHLDQRIDELESRVRFLTNQLDIASREMRPDGRIMAAESAQAGFVVIDKGHAQNLRKGTRFTVFCLRGGQNVTKGMIEVVKVDERISTCRVLQEKDRNDPFIDGDMIHNPVWDPDRTKSFAIRGDFSRFSRTELERFVEQGGGRVDSDLKVGTDFLVAGSHAEQWTGLAVKLGVSILSEEQLLDFIRPQE